MNPEKAELNVSWCLDRAYKIAIHQLGILDWSTTTDARKHQVEQAQLVIAKMLLDAQLGRVNLD